MLPILREVAARKSRLQQQRTRETGRIGTSEGRSRGLAPTAESCVSACRWKWDEWFEGRACLVGRSGYVGWTSSIDSEGGERVGLRETEIGQMDCSQYFIYWEGGREQQRGAPAVFDSEKHKTLVSHFLFGLDIALRLSKAIPSIQTRYSFL